jgi:hypothetical protein
MKGGGDEIAATIKAQRCVTGMECPKVRKWPGKYPTVKDSFLEKLVPRSIGEGANTKKKTYLLRCEHSNLKIAFFLQFSDF